MSAETNAGHVSLIPAMPADVEIAPIDALRERFARLAESSMRRAIADRGFASIAVPGGSAAELLLPRLVRASIDWRRVEVFWVDERAVPPDADDSNSRLARAIWIDRVPLPVDRVHRMPGDAADLHAAAEAYAKTMRWVLGDTPAIDVVLLGLGPDGHVASLFPGHALLGESSRWAAAVEDAPKPPPRRLTLTLPVLQSARHGVVFAAGAAKAAAVAAAIDDPASTLPVALAARGPAQMTFLVDPEAASALRRPIR